MGNKIVKIIGSCVVLALIAGGAYLGSLVYPGTPSKSKSLLFLGYVPLPKSGTLNVLDYITINGDRMFIADERSGNVSRLTLGSAALPTDLQVLAGKPEAHGVVIDPVSHLGFVTRSEANTVDVFDPAAMKLIKSIPVPDDADGIHYDPETKLIYVAGGDSHTGTLLDPATQVVIAKIELGGKPEYAQIDPKTKLLFQNLKDKDQVIAIDLPTRSIVGRWPLPGCQAPSGLALDEAHRRLIIACSGNAKAALFDMDAHRVLTTQPVGGQPDSIAFDSGLQRVYTAGIAGKTTVLALDSPDSLSVLDTIDTHYGAHTLAVDPATHRVYVGYAGVLVAPRLAVFEPIR